MSRVPAFFAGYQERVEEVLHGLVEPGRGPIDRSMAFTLFAPSKRVRPVLTLLSAELCGGTASLALAAAAAMELVHTSSLILDDLPAMDDAALRRGRPANHLEFGEAIAILAAFGLLNLAFGTLARRYEAPLAARLAALLDEAVGNDGLIAGQAADLLATEQEIGFDLLERIHRGKTGALFNASAVAGAMTAGADADSIAALSAFAKNLGLAFQIIDDLLDVEGNPIETGKAIRKDARKTTFVSFSGVTGAHQLAAELCQTADRALTPFGRRADKLRELSAFVAARQHVTLMTSHQGDDPRVDELRQRLRSLGYLDAGVDRFVLGPARATRRPSAIAFLASLRVGIIAALLLGPAAALGLSARLPGLVTGPRDAAVVAIYLGGFLRRRHDRGGDCREPARLVGVAPGWRRLHAWWTLAGAGRWRAGHAALPDLSDALVANRHRWTRMVRADLDHFCAGCGGRDESAAGACRGRRLVGGAPCG